MMWKTVFILCCALSIWSWRAPSFALSLVISPYIEHLNHRNKRDCETAGGSFIKWYDEIYCRRENPVLRQTISQEEFATLSSEQIDNKLAALGLPPIGGIGYSPGHPNYKLTPKQIKIKSARQTLQILQEYGCENMMPKTMCELLTQQLENELSSQPYSE